MPYSPLTHDRVFRHVFGEPESIPLLKSLINAYFKPAGLPLVEHLEFLPRELGSWTLEEKQPVLDLLARDETGRLINIEVQTSAEPDYPKRILYYAASLYMRQLRKGASYRDLRPVVSLSFLEFSDRPGAEWFHAHRDTWVGDLTFLLVELPKLLTQDHAQTGPALKEAWEWGKFIEEPFQIPQDPDLEGEFRSARRRMEEFMALTPDVVSEILAHIRDLDIQTAKLNAADQGRAEGLAQGLTQGLQQGREQGLEQGLERGGRIARLETARKLRSLGVSDAVILEATGLSTADLDAL